MQNAKIGQENLCSSQEKGQGTFFSNFVWEPFYQCEVQAVTRDNMYISMWSPDRGKDKMYLSIWSLGCEDTLHLLVGSIYCGDASHLSVLKARQGKGYNRPISVQPGL